MTLPKREKQIGVGGFVITDLERKYVNDVLDRNRLTYGHYSEEFEKKFAREHDIKHALLCASGTDALKIAIESLKEFYKWKDGDEIIVPAVTFPATINKVIDNRLKPVFVDVDPRTYNIDPAKIADKITGRTRCILPVHLCGLPAEMEEISSIADRHGLKIVEDACEAMFASHKGKKVGSLGDIGCFSTYAAHIIVTGVGGIATTNNRIYDELMKSYANHGRHIRYLHMDDDKTEDEKELEEIVDIRFRFERTGESSRMTELQAAIGLGQLERKEEIMKKRKERVAYLMEHLKQFEDYLQLPWHPKHSEHSFMMFPLVIKDGKLKRRDLVNFLERNNIETRQLLPLLNQPYVIRSFGEIEKEYPVARHLNRNGFYIGCHPEMTQEELEYVVVKFEEFFKKVS